MKLDPEFYFRLRDIKWFHSIGAAPSELSFPVAYAADIREALLGFGSDLWQDIKTEAQGDLTGYLAKHHYDSYGTNWNSLAKQSKSKMQAVVSPIVQSALEINFLPPILLNPILVDLNRAALEYCFRKSFSSAPRFFDQLLDVYQAGRLPAGWKGELANWRSGKFVIF